MVRFAAISLLLSLVVGCSAKQDTTSSTFAEVETWLSAHAPPLLGLLNPPTDEETINAFESRRHLKMPPEVSRLFLIHNGESEKSDGIFGCWKMLPIAEIEKELDLIGEQGMIPLFRSGGGDLYYVKSYDSTMPDTRLLEWWHENPSEAHVIAPSVGQFLTDFNQQLKKGQFVYHPNELEALINRNEL